MASSVLTIASSAAWRERGLPTAESGLTGSLPCVIACSECVAPGI